VLVVVFEQDRLVAGTVGEPEPADLLVHLRAVGRAAGGDVDEPLAIGRPREAPRVDAAALGEDRDLLDARAVPLGLR